MNTAREFFGAYGPTTGNTSAMVAGGLEPGNSVNTEVWNGSSWTDVNNLSTARNQLVGNGSATDALAYGGNTPHNTDITEELQADNTFASKNVM